MKQTICVPLLENLLLCLEGQVTVSRSKNYESVFKFQMILYLQLITNTMKVSV